MGVAGIALSRFFGVSVDVVDYLDEVLDLARENVELNKPYGDEAEPNVFHLDWNSCEDFDRKYDFVIGCELVYAITNCGNLLELLKRILKKDSCLMMIIPKCRTNREEFLKKLKEIGKFEVEESILTDDYYTNNPIAEELGDIFYPLKKLQFSLLLIKFKNSE